MSETKKQTSPRKVTISIACYGKLEFTRQCIDAIERNTDPSLFALNIIDNASKDGTLAYFRDELPKKPFFKKVPVTIMHNTENIGFARAHNMSFLECKSPYFLLLNNDTVPHKNWLEPLIEVLDQKLNVAVVGSKLVSPTINSIQHAGVVFKNGMPIHEFFGMPEDFPSANVPCYMPSVTGACMLVRSDVFKKMEMFDTRYRNGWEDTDLVMKIRKSGLDIYYQPKSVLFHYEGQTDGRMNHDDQNRERFFTTWAKDIMQWGNKIRLEEKPI